jgi:hypothetical protein
VKRCETCAAFKASTVPMDASKPDSPLYGECRAKSPQILARYSTHWRHLAGRVAPDQLG